MRCWSLAGKDALAACLVADEDGSVAPQNAAQTAPRQVLLQLADDVPFRIAARPALDVQLPAIRDSEINFIWLSIDDSLAIEKAW